LAGNAREGLKFKRRGLKAFQTSMMAKRPKVKETRTCPVFLGCVKVLAQSIVYTNNFMEFVKQAGKSEIICKFF